MAKQKKKQKKQEQVVEEQTTSEVATLEVAKQPSQNGVTRPRAGTTTGRVWEISDAISASKGEPAPRGDVMKACEAENINPATAATQYGRWRKFYGLGKYVKPAAAADEAAEVEE